MTNARSVLETYAEEAAGLILADLVQADHNRLAGNTLSWLVIQHGQGSTS